MANFPSKQLDQFTVRFPDGLRDRIKHAAEANNRSMNAEIVATLEEKYPEPLAELDVAVQRYMKLTKELAEIAPLMAKASKDRDLREFGRLEARYDEITAETASLGPQIESALAQYGAWPPRPDD